jgi:hypothetical protein
MSDVSQGEGWWIASDGKWYPPNAQPPSAGPQSAQVPTSASAGSLPSMPAPFAEPPFPGSPRTGAYGAPFGPPAGPPPGPYGAPPGAIGGYGYQPVHKTNGLAIAGFVCSFFFFLVLGSILGIVFGFVARGQIKRSQGVQKGAGLAVAGIIIGFAGIALLVLAIAIPTFFGVNTVSQDRAAQSNLNTAVTSAKAIYASNHTFGSVPKAVSQLGRAEPSLSFVADYVGSTGQQEIAVGVDATGNGLILVNKSGDGQCWGILINETTSQSLVSGGTDEWPNATSAGTWYTSYLPIFGSCSADDAFTATWISNHFPPPA